MRLFDIFLTTTPAQLDLLKQLLKAVPLFPQIQSDPVGSSAITGIHNLIYITGAQRLRARVQASQHSS